MLKSSSIAYTSRPQGQVSLGAVDSVEGTEGNTASQNDRNRFFRQFSSRNNSNGIDATPNDDIANSTNVNQINRQHEQPIALGMLAKQRIQNVKSRLLTKSPLKRTSLKDEKGSTEEKQQRENYWSRLRKDFKRGGGVPRGVGFYSGHDDDFLSHITSADIEIDDDRNDHNEESDRRGGSFIPVGTVTLGATMLARRKDDGSTPNSRGLIPSYFRRNDNSFTQLFDFSDHENYNKEDFTVLSKSENDNKTANPSDPTGRNTLYKSFSNFATRMNNKATNAKIVYEQFGPDATEVLKVATKTYETVEQAIPIPESDDHVIVKVEASSVTLQDCMIRRGFDFDVVNPISLPITPGYDVVGRILPLSSNDMKAHNTTITTVSDGKRAELLKENGLDVGDRVVALVRTGGNARYISVPISSLVKISNKIDSASAVSIVTTYTTAYHVLREIAQPARPTFTMEGKKVLVIMGYCWKLKDRDEEFGVLDNVGSALIEMCHKAHASTIYATAPRKYHSYVKNILKAIPIDPSTPDWIKQVENQMDYVFDGICADGLETPHRAIIKEKSTSHDNRSPIQIVCYGHVSMLQERSMGFFGAPLSAHMNKLRSYYHSSIPSNAKFVDIWEIFQRDPAWYKSSVKSLCHLIKKGKLRPIIGKRITLEDVASAQESLENGTSTDSTGGIIVCKPWNRWKSIDKADSF